MFAKKISARFSGIKIFWRCPFSNGLVRELCGLILILAVFSVLAINARRNSSVTVDEFAHLPAGISYLRMRDFRLYPQTPPFLRMLEALPVAFESEVKLPLERGWIRENIWETSYDFMYANQERYQAIYNRARLSTILLGGILVVLVWRWARALYGASAGLLAGALTAFCPNILAHSCLVTTDIGSCVMFLAVIYSFWKFCKKPNWVSSLKVGVLLGLALLCKFSAIILIPIMFILGSFCFHRFSRSKLLILYFLAMATIAWATLNSCYLWKGFGHKLGEYDFQSKSFKKLANYIPGNMRMPFPYYYVHGFDLQNVDRETKRSVFLLGKLSYQGWWYYYLVAIAVKMTLASLALILAGLISLFLPRKDRLDEFFVWFPPLIIIIGISFLTRMNVGLRYILPAIPFLYILASGSLTLNKNLWCRIFLWIILGAHFYSCVFTYPNYLAYFNCAVGGSQRGYKILADSNLDWGQSLIGLKKYMKAHKLEEICLVNYGLVDPVVYGIQYQLPYKGANCSVLAIGATLYDGVPSLLNDHGKIVFSDKGQWRWLHHQKPVAMVSNAMFIFELGEKNPIRNGVYGLEREIQLKSP